MKPTPTINVNLEWNPHDPETAGRILIPCPVRRSVTFCVVLGECFDAIKLAVLPNARARCGLTTHAVDCPARPVRVSCSISGDWGSSEVVDVALVRMDDGRFVTFETDAAGTAALAICRARWGFIKSALLGHSLSDCPEPIQALRAQRDEVFAALAAMARAEDALEAAAVRCAKALGADGDLTGTSRASHEFLAAYVEQLVEQVGILS